MKRVGLLLFALIMMGGIALAQGPQRGREMTTKERAEWMTERMVKDFSLNDTQKKQLLEANLAWMEKMGNRPGGERMRQGKDVQDKDSVTNKKQKRQDDKKVTKEQRENMMQEMQTARSEYEVQLQKIMTKEQYESYLKKQEERRQRGQRR